MNTHKFKLSLLGTLLVAGAMTGPVQAATVTGVTPAAPVDIVVTTTTITSHTLTANQATIAAGAQNGIAVADGMVKAGATDKLAVRWDSSVCGAGTTAPEDCSISGKDNATHKAKFTLSGKGMTLTAVDAAANKEWFTDGTAAGTLAYVVNLDGGQTVEADTYTLKVDAGVVTP